MHPAKSVIFFTTASGAGYGLLLFLLIGNVLGGMPGDFYFLLFGYGISYLLIVAGLLSSTFHLGHPERAWRALTQWRSSWLSREGVMALLTFIPTGLYALNQVFFSASSSALMQGLGLFGALCCLLTVYCTAMIYASLRPVHAWANRYVPIGYILLSLMTGALLINGLMMLWGYGAGFSGWLALLLLLVSTSWKISYWRFIDGTRSISSPESATGLGEFGSVSLFEAPHTEANYLMKEMGFRIARKHARKLRRIVLVCGFGAPFVLLAFAQVQDGMMAVVAAVVAVGFAGIGVFVERWLFFAEAKHTVGLYYGAGDA